MTVTIADPIALVHDALAAAGCEPHGPAHDFRARCPGHDGENRNALHVSEGVDRRAVLHCFRGCDTKTVVAALGLQMRDLFVPGTRNNVRRARPRQRKRGRLEIMLEALELLEIGVRGMWVIDRCPHCREPGCWLFCNQKGLLDVHCASECPRADIFNSLEAAVAIKEAENAAR